MKYCSSALSVILFSFLLLSLPACRNESSDRGKVPFSDEQLININRELVIKERERIESYIGRKGLVMEMSDAGIWYSLIEEGKGDILMAGDRVRLEYSCSLLDGTLCYSSDQDGNMNITLGKSDIATGLDEALRMLRPGSEAIIILPSNMAYGLVGDSNKIPARAALIYSIKVYTQ